ncbi:TDT family transporter [Murdochiella massiliensis]|uniref:hypothetical protein n=1 Tax=Murdochiella massiliensis TaxID=1673723 RepID=UPI0008296821|nr:hypothetical protein [Murdochiella massiliensis]
MKRRLPLATLSLIAGFAVLGESLQVYRPELRTLCGAIAMVVGIAFIIQSFADSTHLANEMQGPVGFSLFAYFPLALLYLSPYARDYFIGESAKKLFLVGLVAHLILTLYYLYRLIRNRRVEAVQPTSLLFFVGIAVIGETAASFNLIAFGRVFFFIGLATAFPLYALLLWYRLKRRKPAKASVADADATTIGGASSGASNATNTSTDKKKNTGVTASNRSGRENSAFASAQLETTLLAPVGILLAAYPLLFEDAGPLFFFLRIATIARWAISLWRLIGLFIKPFSSGLLLSAFPFAISALALQRADLYLEKLSTVGGATMSLTFGVSMQWLYLLPTLLATLLCYLLFLRLLWNLVK